MNKAVNNSEKFVYEICKKSFLSLWSYINPRGKNPGKELCDILVICDPHIIVISVKDIQLKDTVNPSVDWKRWQRKAIDDSIKQIRGAIRYLDQTNCVVQKDGSQGLQLPVMGNRIYHRIAVAFGGRREVPISSHADSVDEIYHVLDEKSVFFLLRHLDTISDFVRYLIDKEKLLSDSSIIFEGGEENLLAIYIHNGRKFPSNKGMIILENNLWERVSKKPEFKAKLQKDSESYIWDGIIEVLCHGGFNRDSWLGPDMPQSELAIRTLVKEDRFSRRMLGIAFREFLKLSEKGHINSRCVQSVNGVGYVFFAYDSSSTLEERKSELAARCYASIYHFQECFTVIGIGVCIPGKKPRNGYSTDLVFLQAQSNRWTEHDLKQSKYCREELDLFNNINKTDIYEDEYPELENTDND